MALLEILKYPDSRLRLLSEPVVEFNKELQTFVEDMKETMYSFHGIGLAAPQVNNRIRLLITDTRRKDEEGRYDYTEFTELEKAVTQPLVLINPEIIEKKGETSFDEGCLSLPSYFETVKRFDWIKVRAKNEYGEEIIIETDGLLAICIQHEIDHLDGKLFIDRLSTLKANKIKNKIKKYGYPEKSDNEDETKAEI